MISLKHPANLCAEAARASLISRASQTGCQKHMMRSWGATTLLCALAMDNCVSFVLHPCVSIVSRVIPLPVSPWGRGGIPQVLRGEHAFAQQSIVSEFNAVDLQGQRCAGCTPLMMAKAPKLGKGKGMGKAGRMDLIESGVAAAKNGKRREGDSDADGQEEEEEVDAAEGETFSIDRLKAETKTPFRTVGLVSTNHGQFWAWIMAAISLSGEIRVFLYGGFGVSALIGGLTALSQLAATLSNQPGALELQKVLVNLLVDFGVMAFAAFCYIFETSQQEELEKAEADARNRRQRLEATKITSDVNAERVGQLRGLRVKVPGTGTGQDLEGAKEVPVGVLMDEAKQSFCVLAGGRDFIRDSMVAAMLAKNQVFPTVNLMVVPVDSGVDVDKGFGRKNLSYESEGYVAAPADEAQWRAVMAEELGAAERQGALSQSSSKDGIVLVVSRQGKVLRRGVGIPAWKAIREDVEPQVEKKDD